MPNFLKKAKIPLLAVLFLIAITTIAQRYSLSFQYDRPALTTGEYWRFITCHFTHTGWNHLFLNWAGAVLIFSLFYELYEPLHWLIGALCCIISISLNLLFLHPSVEWYAGLSGLLHGLFAMGIIREIQKGNILYCLAMFGLAGKLVMEYLSGPSSHTRQLIDADIITNVHLSGALTGGLTACVILLFERPDSEDIQHK